MSGERSRNHLTNALAGLQAGIVGALFMLLWCLIAAAWTRRSFWVIPNLYASGFYGPKMFVNGFMRGSWSGVAIMIFFSGVFGLIWGFVQGGERKPYLTPFAALAGLLIYYFVFHLVLPHVRPLIPVYAPEGQIRIGFLIWGIALARSPIYAERIAAGNSSPAIR